MMDWWIPLALYAFGIMHHAFAWRSETRLRELACLHHRKLEMLQEAIALAKYGAISEAHDMVDEAVAFGEDKLWPRGRQRSAR